MGTFNSSKTVPYFVEDLAPVAQDVMRHFESQDYEVTETNIPAGRGQIGRPRIKGERLPNLSVVAEDPETVWKPTQIAKWYGSEQRMV